MSPVTRSTDWDGCGVVNGVRPAFGSQLSSGYGTERRIRWSALFDPLGVGLEVVVRPVRVRDDQRRRPEKTVVLLPRRRSWRRKPSGNGQVDVLQPGWSKGRSCVGEVVGIASQKIPRPPASFTPWSPCAPCSSSEGRQPLRSRRVLTALFRCVGSRSNPYHQGGSNAGRCAGGPHPDGVR